MLSNGLVGSLTIRTSQVVESHAHKAGFTFVDEGEYLLIEVEDTGHGIHHENLQKIFNPFFTTKPQGLGTGLGLSTSYGIIKQSGGYICPVSEVGSGTNFHIYLPALSADQIPVGAETEAELQQRTIDVSGSGHVLLVEDEAGLRGVIAALLTSHGYEVSEAEDGDQAIRILQDNPHSFDLVISDIIMPGMDGITLISEAKELLGNSPVIFISGNISSDLVDALSKDRDVSFLPKPFTLRQLIVAVKNKIDHATQNQISTFE